jgi:hypothetical protein
MRPRRNPWLCATGLTLALAASGAGAAKPPPCEGGSFVVETPTDALVPGSAVALPDVIVVGAGTATIASGCPEVPGKLRASRKGTRLSAKWTKKKGLCAGLPKRASLKARFDASCEVLTGKFKSRGVKRTFSARRGEPAVGAGNVAALASQIERSLAAAIADLIAALPAASAASRRGARPGGGPGAEPFEAIALAGVRGGAVARGLRFASHGPTRYELSLELDDYVGVAGEVGLSGSVEYNFVAVGEPDAPREHGLLRGQLQLSGPFGGEVEVHASILDGVPGAAVVTAASGTHHVGEGEPPPFLAWVSTVAGGNGPGLEDGPAAQARFDTPAGIAVDDEGRLYLADSENGAIREIAPDGNVSTLATGFGRPSDLGLDAGGDLVVSDRLISVPAGTSELARVELDGPARGTREPIVGGDDDTLCSLFYGQCDGRPPIGGIPYAWGIDVGAVTLVAQWALFAAVRAVLPDGFVITIADLTFANHSPLDLVAGRSGEIYYTTNDHTVRVRRPDGSTEILAGTVFNAGRTDGPGDVALFSSPHGIVYDGLRTLYIAEWSGYLVRQVDTLTGETTTVAGCRLPRCRPTSGQVDGDGELATFESLENLVLDRSGDLWVSDRGNHAIRLVRILADPDREPAIVDFAPHTVQQGETARVVVRGRNLTLTSTVDLGPGVVASIESAGYRELVLSVAVAADAQEGPRTLELTTPYGVAEAGAGLAFRVLEDARGGAMVSTLAGSGSLLAAAQDILPGPLTAFAFPTGLYAESGDRILVADPYAHNVRLIATKVGIVAEIVDLITASALGADVNLLDAILGGLGSIGSALDSLGIRQAWTDNAEDAIRDLAEEAVDAVCAGADCTWMSMPWAGVPFAPGESNGFRMGARLRFPSDIHRANASTYYIADTGNDRLRIVGYDPEEQEDVVNEVFNLDRFRDWPFAVATGPADYLVAYASLPEGPLLGRVDVENDELLNQWAGDRGEPRCEQAMGSPWPPIGIPIGMDGDDDSLWVADPYCKTVWQVEEQSAVGFVRDVRTGNHVEAAPKCSDGPAAFATFGAPVDVAVVAGTVYVADAGCHSIRAIRAKGFDPTETAALLDGFLEQNAGRIGVETAAAIQGKLDALDTEFLDQNRYWVETIAGSTDGVAGFADGPAAEARFRYPTGIAAAEFQGGVRIFVADTGNRRLRMIELP